MFEGILVPLDGSVCAESALALAECIPSERVHLLTVKSDMVQIDELCEAAADGEAYLARIAEPLRLQGRKVTTDVAFGDARRQIVAFTAMADLVIMGSRGCSATHTLLLGSVADWVARHSPIPTLIVRGGSDPATSAALTRIVVPLDGAPISEEALPMACRLAADLDLPVHLIRVLEFDLARASVEAGMAAAQASAKLHEEAVTAAAAYLVEQAQALGKKSVMATSEVRTGAVAPALLDALRAGDLVVLTTRERGGLARWALGSVADELVRHAPCPVLLVRPSRAKPTTQRRGVDAGTGASSTSPAVS